MGINRVRMAQLREVIDEGLDLGCNFTINPITIHHDAEYGRRELGNPIRRVFLPLDAGRSAALFQSRTGKWLPRPAWALGLRAARLGARLGARGQGGATSGRDLGVTTIERFDERFDALAATALAEFQLAGRRDASFLNWRFADPRAGRYRVRAVEEAGGVAGYVVTSPFEERLRIVDLLVAPGRDDVVVALVQEARATGAYALEAWSQQRHPYRRVLRRCGFFQTPSRPGFSYRMTRPRPEFDAIADRDAAIHLTAGDCDFI